MYVRGMGAALFDTTSGLNTSAVQVNQTPIITDTMNTAFAKTACETYGYIWDPIAGVCTNQLAPAAGSSGCPAGYAMGTDADGNPLCVPSSTGLPSFLSTNMVLIGGAVILGLLAMSKGGR